MRQPHYLKMEGSETFQEMWAVKMDRNTSKSSEILGEHSDLYFHL